MDDERSHPEDRSQPPGGRSRSPGVSDAVEARMQAYLLFTARGAPEDEAFQAALGRSIDRYMDSLDPEAGLRLLLGFYPPGSRIPEERMLPEDPEELAATREAAKRLAEAGEIRRVSDTATGRVYWLRTEVRAGERQTD
ncbi:hypothetical protein GBA63_21745 (plasmid) [Rubrobacter tropicus]|uniref:Uncharacterized protein n=1 Tax=Rubrobacter tropicus TaxID=2653851 RepID=A0A6G8QFR9_9ACTN|nr:hypothetical protein [Rubrobacter tropicus]QIN85345.1 hypothetical protein GBA63_21745 [Rubrobacter tropicus]